MKTYIFKIDAYRTKVSQKNSANLFDIGDFSVHFRRRYNQQTIR